MKRPEGQSRRPVEGGPGKRSAIWREVLFPGASKGRDRAGCQVHSANAVIRDVGDVEAAGLVEAQFVGLV